MLDNPDGSGRPNYATRLVRPDDHLSWTDWEAKTGWVAR